MNPFVYFQVYFELSTTMASDAAQKHFQEGCEHLNRGNDASAIASFSEAIRLDPTFDLAFVNRGVAYKSIGKYELAIADYSAAINISPDYAHVYSNRGVVYAELNKLELALDDYSEAIKRDPQLSMAYMNRGQTYATLQDYLLAVTDFSKAISLNPKYTKAYSGRGRLYQDLGNHRSSLKDYAKAIELNPRTIEVYNNRATLYVELGKFDLAIEDYNTAIKIAPEIEALYINRGVLLTDLAQYDLALIDFTKALQLNPSSIDGYLNRGKVYQKQDDLKLAIADYNECLRLNPNNPSALGNQAAVYADMGYYSKGVETYLKAIKLDSRNASLYYNLANVYAHQYEYKLCIEANNKAIELNPSFAQAYFNRGLTYKEIKEHEIALIDFSYVIRLLPRFALAYKTRGDVLTKFKDFVAAVNDYTKAIELDPQFAEAYNNRGITQVNLEKYSLAIADFYTALKYDPTLTTAYFNLAYAYELQHDYGLAQTYFTRFIFIGDIKDHDVPHLLSFFRDFAEAPFTVNRLLARTGIANQHLLSYKGFLTRLEEQSQPIQDFISLLVMRNEERQERFWHINGLIHYFMGDAAEAYRIFSEQIEPNNSLKLISYYYYIKTAVFSALSQTTVHLLQTSAIKAAHALSQENSQVDLVECYYAGLILYEFSDLKEQAVGYFRRAKALLPAHYMLWFIALYQEKALLKKEIIEREAKLPLHKRFYKGIYPTTIGREFSTYWGTMQHFCFYNEIALALQEMYAGEVALPVCEFFQYWRPEITEKERQELSLFRKAVLAEKNLTKIGVTFDEMKKRLDHQLLEKELVESVTSIMREFEALQSDAKEKSGEELERRLASHIYESAIMKEYVALHLLNFNFIETHLKIATFFFLTDKINTRTTVTLLLYAIYTAQRFNPQLMPQIVKEGLVEGTIDDIKGSKTLNDILLNLAQGVGSAFAITWGSTLSIFLISFTVKTLWLMINETLLKPNANLPAGRDYLKFKEDLDVQLRVACETNLDFNDLDKFLNL